MECKKIAVIFRQQDKEARELSHIVAKWLHGRGLEANVCESGTCGQAWIKNCQLAIVAGGDGTILGVGRMLAGTGIPFFGINFGRVGYLTAANRENWPEQLGLALDGTLAPEAALALSWELWQGSEKCGEGVAVNEIVLGRGQLARLASIQVELDGCSLPPIRSDGIIVSSPTGSTGYCASAGGPALFPNLNALVLLAICPFMASMTPMVVPATCQITLAPLPDSPQCWLTVDGQSGFALKPGQFALARGWPGAISFFGNSARFFNHLHLRRPAECGGLE